MAEVKIESAASTEGHSKYIKYVYFPWPSVGAALSF
jgi:hypothetical protein